MMIFKFLILFLTANVANALVPPSNQEAAYISQKNILINPGFENGSAKWSASGGSFTITTTFANVGSGERAASWDSNAANQTFTSTAVPIPAGDYGANYEVSANLKCGSGTCTHLIEAFDGTNVIASQAITSSTTYTRTTLNFVAPTSGNISARIRSVAADEPVLYIDDVYLGRARNVGTVAQAELVGTIAASGCGGWSTTSGSFINFSPLSGCTYITTGSVLPPTTNIPGFRLVNQMPGKYVFRFIGNIGQQDAVNTYCEYRFSDGTKNAQTNYNWAYNATASTNTLGGNITYESSIQDATIQIQGRRGNGSGTCRIYDFSNIEVYRYPLQSEIAVRPETQNVYGSVKYTYTGSGYIGSSVVTTNTRTPLTLSNLQNYASYIGRARPCSDPNRFCIRFENLPAGDYEAFFTSGNDNGTGDNSNCLFSISDGTSYLPPEIYHNYGGTSARWTSSYIAHFSYNNTQTREFYIVARNHSGPHGCKLYFGDGVSLGGPIQLGLRPLSQSLPAPNLVGSVTSQTPDSLRIESAEIGLDSSPYIIRQNGNWIQSISFVSGGSSGTWSLLLKPGIFKTAPICTLSTVGFADRQHGVIFSNSTNGTIYTFCHVCGGGLPSMSAYIMCIGPRGSL
jgi:hypothetical protein